VAAALWSVQPGAYVLTLALAGAAARWGAVVHLRSVPYARPGDPSPAARQRPPVAVLSANLALVAALVAAGAPALARGAAVALGGIALATAALGWSRTRLGGAAVGDTYGFAVTVGEVGALITAAVATTAQVR